jgi:hypothetical protein
MKALKRELTTESICWNDGITTARKNAITQPIIRMTFHSAMALNVLRCMYFPKYFVYTSFAATWAFTTPAITIVKDAIAYAAFAKVGEAELKESPFTAKPTL